MEGISGAEKIPFYCTVCGRRIVPLRETVADAYGQVEYRHTFHCAECGTKREFDIVVHRPVIIRSRLLND